MIVGKNVPFILDGNRISLSVVALCLYALTMSMSAACDHLFIDVGSNSGDSLVRWFTQHNCYENCYERRPHCLPTNETCGKTGECTNANSTCFCHRQAKANRCGWEWPWWFPLGVRRRYCAEAFEPNPLLQNKLRHTANQLVSRGAHIKIHNGTALAGSDGFASFGLDLSHTFGSSLVLDKKTMGANRKPGRGVAVGENKVTVRTLDAVRYLRSLPHKHISLKLDVEGTEFTMVRDLLVSGVLCERVDNLWIEWHDGGRIDWRTMGLPLREDAVQRLYMWMIQSVQDHRIVTRADLSPHCRTFLGRWA